MIKVLVIGATAFVCAIGAIAMEATQRSGGDRISVAHGDSQPGTKGPPELFTGSVLISSQFEREEPARVSGAKVTFEPGARAAWHRHPLGQTLIVTAGSGWVQQWGGERKAIQKGDVVWIPPNVKHWHGANASARMTHIAIQERLGTKYAEWLEHVSDEQYRALPRAHSN